MCVKCGDVKRKMGVICNHCNTRRIRHQLSIDHIPVTVLSDWDGYDNRGVTLRVADGDVLPADNLKDATRKATRIVDKMLIDGLGVPLMQR